MERGSVFVPVMAAISCFNIGLIVGHGLGENSAHADERVEQAQKYNQELTSELSKTHKLVAQMIVKDGENTYSFHTVNQEGQDQTCEGSYEVKNQTAVAVGNLACTVTTPVHG
jgi:hypothetical protein